MTRFGKSAKKKRSNKRKQHSHDWHNGGGTEPHNVKCEKCSIVQRGGEQYKHPQFDVTPCICGSVMAHYEPQLLADTQ